MCKVRGRFATIYVPTENPSVINFQTKHLRTKFLLLAETPTLLEFVLALSLLLESSLRLVKLSCSCISLT